MSIGGSVSHLFYIYISLTLIYNIVYYSEAEDYGGPRKEFFHLFLTEARDMLTENDCELVNIDAHVDSQLYYVYGLITGKENFE